MVIVSFLLLSLPKLLVASTYPDEFKARDERLATIQNVARTERDLILKLVDIKETHSDPESELAYFLEFLLADSGYPFDETVESVVQYPTDRFKIVERFLYDWPMIAEVVDSLEVEPELDIMAEFERTVPRLPSHSDLNEIVRELNEVLAIDRVEPYDIAPDATDFNTGNFMILTNASHALGHVKSCVDWGDLADSDLIFSDEPFTIPGEEHWLHQYLVYLECLVKLEDEDKAKVVREEILKHYRGRADVKEVVKVLSRGKGKLKSRDSEIDVCVDRSPLDTHCYLELSRDTFYPMRIEKLAGTPIILHRGAGDSIRSQGDRLKSGDVVLDNRGGKTAVSVVLVGKGTIVVEPGDALIVHPTLISHVCATSHGTIDVYSV